MNRRYDTNGWMDFRSIERSVRPPRDADERLGTKKRGTRFRFPSSTPIRAAQTVNFTLSRITIVATTIVALCPSVVSRVVVAPFLAASVARATVVAAGVVSVTLHTAIPSPVAHRVTVLVTDRAVLHAGLVPKLA